MSEQYKPLYPPEGGPLCGFVCCARMMIIKESYDPNRQCGNVTRTERGMIMHLKSVHGIEIQTEMFNQIDDAIAGKERGE